MSSYYSDLIDSLKRFELVNMLGGTNRKSRFARTLIGNWWFFISQGSFILVVGITMSMVWGQSIKTYLPYLAISTIIWIYIVSALNGAPNVLIGNKSFFYDDYYERSIFTMAFQIQLLTELLYSLPLLIIIQLIYVPWTIDFQIAFFFIINLIIFLLIINNLVFTLAILGTRYRDIASIVAVLTQILYFVTPVIWSMDQVSSSEARIYLELNPFYILIRSVRDPFYGKCDINTTLFIFVILLVTFLFAHVAYKKMSNKIVYWI